jgi:hypothetical protein
MWVIESAQIIINDGDEIFIPVTSHAIKKTIQILKEMRKELNDIISTGVKISVTK